MITPSHDFRLMIDFSRVQNIPEDARKRLPYFSVFKELIQIEKEKIKSWHRSGAGGREVIQSQTSLVDEVIRYVLISLAHLEKYQSIPVLKNFCIVLRVD